MEEVDDRILVMKQNHQSLIENLQTLFQEKIDEVLKMKVDVTHCNHCSENTNLSHECATRISVATASQENSNEVKNSNLYTRHDSQIITHEYLPPASKLFFNGEHYKGFMEKFMNMAKKYNWGDNQKRDDIVSRLEGKALEYFTILKEEEKASFQLLTQKLERRYG